MEVHGRQPGELPRDQYIERQAELQRANQERVRKAREIIVDLARQRQERLRTARELQLSQHADDADQARQSRSSEARADRGRDAIELSDAARDPSQADAERAQRLKALREASLSGTLNTPERIDQAAQRLLGG